MKRSIATLLVFGQISLLASCHETIDGVGNSANQNSLIAGVLGTNDLGAAMFILYRNRVAAQPDPAVRTAELAALDARRTDFVQAVNDIINAKSAGGGLQTAQTVFALVDDGTLPQMADDAASTLELLQQDPAAQQAIVTLLQSATAAATAKNSQIPIDDLIALLARLDNYPDVAKLWGATADIINQNPQLVTNLLQLGSSKLQAAQPPSATTTNLVAGIISGLEGTLLDPAQLRSGQSFGAPEWVVRLDSRGYALVATDPATGTLVAPFVDSGNGLAAVDAQGNFIDASGAPISIVPFGTPGTPGFDAQGRALTPSGQLAFVFFDAKETTLALELKLAGDLLRANADQHGMNVLAAALGPQKPDGTYADGPVGDLAYGGLELLAQDDTPRLLNALATLLQTDPARAERLLLAVSRAVDKIKAARSASAQAGGLASVPLSDPRMVQLTDDLLPLVDEIFTVPAAGGPSTARVLFDTLNTLTTQVPDWPARVAPLAIMHRIQPAVAVDYSHAATYVDANGNTVDNRSSVHQLLDLLAKADGCTIPFTSTSMAEFILSSMASLSPATVTTLTSLVSSIPGFLINIACPNLSNDIGSLDDLAKTGSLDALLPIAKAFKDKGEIKLLVKILVRVNQSYASTLRGTEPDTNRILASGAVEELCGLIGESTTITDPASGKRLADILADSTANLVDQHSSNVSNRHGQRVPSLAYLLLLPLRDLDARLRAANVTQDLSALGDAFVTVILARTADPNTGQEVLANGCVLPFLTKALSVAASTVPVDPAQRRSLATQAESSVTTFVTSKDMGSLVNLGQTILNASSRPLIDAAIVNLLTPNASVPDDIFGAVVKLLAIELQSLVATSSTISTATAQALVDLEHFAGKAIDPSRPVVQDFINGITKLLLADKGMTLLNVQRAAFNVSPSSGKAPAAVLIHIFQAVSTAGAQANGSTGPAPALSLADLQDMIQKAITAIRDQKGVVHELFDLIRHRKK